MAQESKISVTDNQEKSIDIKVKENERLLQQQKDENRSEKELEKIYSDDNAKFYRPTKNAGLIWLAILLAIIFGLLAGTAGGVLILTTGKIKIPFGQEINLKKYLPINEVNLTTEKKITVTQDVRIAELAKELSQQLVNVYINQNGSDSENLLDQVYYGQKSLGQGFALTNDGWLVLNKKIFGDWSKKYLVINQQSVGSIGKTIFDQANGLVFIKSDLKNLVAMKMATRDTVTPGQQVLIFAPDNSLVINQLSNLNYRSIKQNQGLLRSTDQFSDYLLLQTPVSDKYVGSPVLGLDRSVIGLLIDNDLIKPCWQFNGSVSLVLGNKKIVHPFLGLNYLNLSEVSTINPEFKNLNEGALVWGTPIKNSPAEVAGLKDRDLITKADGLPLNKNYDLTQIIQDHRSGDIIELIIARQGTEKNIKVTLGEK